MAWQLPDQVVGMAEGAKITDAEKASIARTVERKRRSLAVAAVSAAVAASDAGDAGEAGEKTAESVSHGRVWSFLCFCRIRKPPSSTRLLKHYSA